MVERLGPLNKRFVKPQTAQEAVLYELRRRIVSGEFAPGSQILQDALADELGVSRVPVREALRTLEGEGQVSYEPHRGYFVVELDLNELVEIYRLRDLLEPEATAKAFPNITKEDLNRMEESMRDMVQAIKGGDNAAMTAANRRFHFSIFAPCRMPRLIRILDQLWNASDIYRAVYFFEFDRKNLMHSEHIEIFEALKRRDLQTLLDLLQTHRTHAIPALKRLLGREKAVAGK